MAVCVYITSGDKTGEVDMDDVDEQKLYIQYIYHFECTFFLFIKMSPIFFSYIQLVYYGSNVDGVFTFHCLSALDHIKIVKILPIETFF